MAKQKQTSTSPLFAIIPTLPLPSLPITKLPTIGIPNIELPYPGIKPNSFLTYTKPRYAKSLGDILLGNPQYGTKQMQNTLRRHNGPSAINDMPILNRLDAAKWLLYDTTIGELVEHDYQRGYRRTNNSLGKAAANSAINMLEVTGKSLDILANPVKSLFKGAGGGKEGDFLKSMGWLENEYREDYQWNTGNWGLDLALEMASDPLNLVSLGTSGIGKAGAEAIEASSKATQKVLSNATKDSATIINKMSSDVTKRFAEEAISRSTRYNSDLGSEFMQELLIKNTDDITSLTKAVNNYDTAIVELKNIATSYPKNSRTRKDIGEVISYLTNQRNTIAALNKDTLDVAIRNIDPNISRLYSNYKTIASVRQGTKDLQNLIQDTTGWLSGTKELKLFTKYVIKDTLFQPLWNSVVKKLNDYAKPIIEDGDKVKYKAIINDPLNIAIKQDAIFINGLEQAMGFHTDYNTLYKNVLDKLQNIPTTDLTDEMIHKTIYNALIEQARPNSIFYLLKHPEEITPKYQRYLEDISKDIYDRVGKILFPEDEINKQAIENIRDSANKAYAKIKNKVAHAPEEIIERTIEKLIEPIERASVVSLLVTEVLKQRHANLINKTISSLSGEDFLDIVRSIMLDPNARATDVLSGVGIQRNNIKRLSTLVEIVDSKKAIYEELINSTSYQNLIKQFGNNILDKTYRTNLNTISNQIMNFIKSHDELKPKELIEALNKSLLKNYNINLNDFLDIYQLDIALAITKNPKANDIMQLYGVLKGIHDDIDVIAKAMKTANQIKSYYDAAKDIVTKTFNKELPNYKPTIESVDFYSDLNSSFNKQAELELDLELDKELKPKNKYNYLGYRLSKIDAFNEYLDYKAIGSKVSFREKMLQEIKTLTEIVRKDYAEANFNDMWYKYDRIIKDINKLKVYKTKSEDPRLKISKQMRKMHNRINKQLDSPIESLQKSINSLRAAAIKLEEESGTPIYRPGIAQLNQLEEALNIIKINPLKETPEEINLQLKQYNAQMSKAEMYNAKLSHYISELKDENSVLSKLVDPTSETRLLLTNTFKNNPITNEAWINIQANIDSLIEVNNLYSKVQNIFKNIDVDKNELSRITRNLYDELYLNRHKALETIDTSDIAKKLTYNHKELQEAIEEVLDEYRINVINNVKNRYNLDDITFANYSLSSKHDMLESIQTLRNLFGDATGITDENLAEYITYNAEAAKVISQLSGFEEEIYSALNDLSRTSDLAEAGARTIREARNNNLAYETANVYRTIGKFNEDLQERTTFDIYDLYNNKVGSKSVPTKLYQGKYGLVLIPGTEGISPWELNKNEPIGVKKLWDPKWFEEYPFLKLFHINGRGRDSYTDNLRTISILGDLVDSYQGSLTKLNNKLVISDWEKELYTNTLRNFFKEHPDAIRGATLDYIDKLINYLDNPLDSHNLQAFYNMMFSSSINLYAKDYRDISMKVFESLKETNPSLTRESVTDMIDKHYSLANFMKYNYENSARGLEMNDEDLDNILKTWDIIDSDMLSDIVVPDVPIHNLTSNEAARLIHKNTRNNKLEFDKLKKAATRIEESDIKVSDFFDLNATDSDSLKRSAILRSYGIHADSKLSDPTVQAFLKAERESQKIQTIWNLTAEDITYYINHSNKGLADYLYLQATDPEKNAVAIKEWTKNKALSVEPIYIGDELKAYRIMKGKNPIPESKLKDITISQPNYIVPELQKYYDDIMGDYYNRVNWNEKNPLAIYYAGESFNPYLDLRIRIAQEDLGNKMEQNLYSFKTEDEVNNFIKNKGRVADSVFFLDTKTFNQLSENLGDVNDHVVIRNSQLKNAMFNSLASQIASENRVDKYLALFWDKSSPFTLNNKLVKKMLEHKDIKEINELLNKHHFDIVLLKEKDGRPIAQKFFLKNMDDLKYVKDHGGLIVPHEIYRNMVMVMNTKQIDSALYNILHMFIKPTYMTAYLANIGFPVRNFIDSALFKNMSSTDGLESLPNILKNEVKAAKMINRYNEILRDIKAEGMKTLGRETLNKRTTYDILKNLPIEDQKLFLFMNFYTNTSALGTPTEIESMFRNMHLRKINEASEETDSFNALVKKYGRMYDDWLANDLPIVPKILDINNNIEEISRLGLILKMIDDGHSSSDIIAKVAETHFDYDLKHLGQDTLADLFMFETFPINNVLYFLNESNNNPSVQNLLFDAMELSYDNDDISWEDVKKSNYLTQQALMGNIKIGNYIFKIGSSYLDFIQTLTNMFGTVTERLNPIFKMFLEPSVDTFNPFTGQINRINQIEKFMNTGGKEGTILPGLYTKTYDRKNRKYYRAAKTYTSKSYGRGRPYYPRRIRKPHNSSFNLYRQYTKPYYFKRPNTIDWAMYKQSKNTIRPFYKMPAHIYYFYKRKASKANPSYLNQFSPTIY